MRFIALSTVVLVASCASGPPSASPPAPSPAMTDASSEPSPAATPGGLSYPETRAESIVDTLHGTRVADPYRWLEDEKAPEVTAWLDAQDGLARAELDRLPGRAEFAERVRELTYLDVVSAPVRRGGKSFFIHRHADKEKGILYVRAKEGAEPRVVLDPNTWGTREGARDGEDNHALGNWAPSHDGKKLAYTVKENNSDEATLYVLDVETGARSSVDVIRGAKYAHASWTPSGDGFYYTRLPLPGAVPVAERPGHAEVYFHRLGADPKTDSLVREKTGDPERFIGAAIARDGSLLTLGIYHGWSSSELYAKDPRQPNAPWTPIATGTKHTYRASAHAGKLYVMTDDGASRWRVVRVDPKRPERSAWQEIVPEHPTATLEDVSLVGGKLLLHYLERASSRLELRELDGSKPQRVELPALGTVAGIVGDPTDPEAFFAYESFVVPREVHALDVATGKTRLVSKVDANIDASRFVVEQTVVTSKDGTKVTMFIVRDKSTTKTGARPTYLYGYGGFQISKTPFFAASVFPWLEAGGVYAMPNLRGGGEYGEAWHKDGMLDKKQNVFDDFIASAEHLVAEGWTEPGRIAIAGGSNGGLLVGAAMVQRPDLFGAVICAVPLLDMVRYHLFGSGRTWISEYGSADDPALFRAIHAYSPYHHVKEGVAYPPTLMMAADSDDRVDPLHARKFVAMLQARSSGGPVLLRVERNAGHGGADLRKSEVEKAADRLAFALLHTKNGHTKKGPPAR